MVTITTHQLEDIVGVVAEGMDGTGKSNLVRRLSKDLGVPIHERACTSTGGPRNDLYDWVVRDLDTAHEQPPSVYDRHPMISDYIYGPIVRQWMDERFLSSEARILLKRFAANNLVIFCQPSTMAMAENFKLSGNHQLAGVAQNFMRLVHGYQAFFVQYQGEWLPWDYQNSNYEEIVSQASAHLRTRQGVRIQ